MITVRINNKGYKVATSWKDVEDIDALLECATVFEEIQKLSNIPLKLLTLMSEEQLFAISNLTSFLESVEDIELFATPVKIVDVEVESYEKLEAAKAVMQQGKLYQQLVNVARVYYPEEKNTLQLISYGVELYKAVAAFLDKYKEMYSRKPDEQQLQAGVEALSAFGVFGTAYVLAGKDILKMDAILSRPAVEIYTALYYSYQEAQYMERLYEIKYPKKQKES